MIAEIHGKISSRGSNLNDRLEDQLTGDFFGSLQYVTYKNGLFPFLSEANFNDGQQRRLFEDNIAEIKESYVGHHMKFWKKEKNSEIDVQLDFPNMLIGIEVKYLSGLSSDDQLEREANDLISLSNGRPVFLLLLAAEPDVNVIVQQTLKKRNLPEQILFGYLSWQSVLRRFQNVAKNDLELHERLIYKDLIVLLKESKGFTRFEDFNHLHIQPVRLGLHFQINSKAFEFTNFKTKIEREWYYEFR